MWAATSEGVYRLDTSKSGAVTSSRDWKLSLDVVAATSLSVNPRRPDEVVAACGDFASPGHGLYKTRDGGATWTTARARPAGELPGQGRAGPLGLQPRDALREHRQHDTSSPSPTTRSTGRRHENGGARRHPPIRKTNVSNVSIPPRRCSDRPPSCCAASTAASPGRRGARSRTPTTPRGGTWEPWRCTRRTPTISTSDTSAPTDRSTAARPSRASWSGRRTGWWRNRCTRRRTAR